MGRNPELLGSDAVAHVVRHTGVSFVPGSDVVHFWIRGADADLLRRRWTELLTARGLTGELTLRDAGDGALHGYAETFLFLALFLLRGVIEPRREPGDVLDAELIAKLEQSALDAYGYSTSYRWHYRIAAFRRWVAIPVPLGGRPSLFIGSGRYSRLLIMNVDQSASAPLAWMSIDKAYGRDIFVSHGFPVAPGAVAATASEVAARARELGFPVALKKSDASADSDGVILGLETESACIDAAGKLLAAGQKLIVERMVQGVELRLHFIHGRLFRILRSEPLCVTGDGVATLADLLSRDHPNYFSTVSRTEHYRRRLALQFFRLGVREFSDLSRMVPRKGEIVRVSSATGARMTRLGPDALHPADRRALEDFLARYGSPGAGVDLILPSLGARLDSGGAILEMNIPCGFGYLGDDAPRAADLELLETARRSPGFVAAGGRVPLELAVPDEFPPGSTARASLVSRFSKRRKGARIASLAIHRLASHSYQRHSLRVAGLCRRSGD